VVSLLSNRLHAFYSNMKRLGTGLLIGIALTISGFLTSAFGDAPRSTPDFREVYDLLRANRGALSDQELNDAAVKGLIEQLRPRVQLLGEPGTPAATNLITRATVFEGDIAYFRVGAVEEGASAALQAAFQGLSSSNRLRGLALDLRFASGNDFSAAAATADLFIRKEQLLLSWNENKFSSKAKTDNISMPVAVLINPQTTGAAEALAAILREAGVALILGRTSAGQAMTGQDLPLKSGQRLRVATSPVHLGKGQALSKGVQPDISVDVSTDDEKIYFADAFSTISRVPASVTVSTNNASITASNRLSRRARFNEAELVRERREGASLENPSESRRDRDPEKPTVSDPVLSRALDLLKGLAVVRQYKS
jgi:hypothetical protein